MAPSVRSARFARFGGWCTTVAVESLMVAAMLAAMTSGDSSSDSSSGSSRTLLVAGGLVVSSAVFAAVSRRHELALGHVLDYLYMATVALLPLLSGTASSGAEHGHSLDSTGGLVLGTVVSVAWLTGRFALLRRAARPESVLSAALCATMACWMLLPH